MTNTASAEGFIAGLSRELVHTLPAESEALSVRVNDTETSRRVDVEVRLPSGPTIAAVEHLRLDEVVAIPMLARRLSSALRAEFDARYADHGLRYWAWGTAPA